jgi:hypothetical protein
MIAAATSAFLSNIAHRSDAQGELAGGVPFISDADLEDALDQANVSSRATDAALTAYDDAQINGLRSELGILALMALYLGQRTPSTQPRGAPT